MGEIVGLILAGGDGTRLGQRDKARIEIGGQSLLDRAASNITTQLDNAAVVGGTRHTMWLPLLSDARPGKLGPLSGILSGLFWAGGLTPPAKWVAVTPVDCPLMPLYWVDKLKNAIAGDEELVLARANDGRHGLIGLWQVSVANKLADYLDHDRAVHRFIEKSKVTWVDGLPDETFMDIDTPEDLDRLSALIGD